MAIVRVYIDGFNLYYGALKNRGPGVKWLDVAALSRRLAGKKHTLDLAVYCTAILKNLPWDPTASHRQTIYIDALEDLADVKVVRGHFRKKPGFAPTPIHRDPMPHLTRIWKVEEKGSDVNLGAHLLMDGFRGRYERAVVVTNDSDLETPIRMVRDELLLPITVINPHIDSKVSKKLSPAATTSRTMTAADVAACQLPNPFTGISGVVHIPHPTW